MTFTGSSFYDTLNKMLIGFLILLPWIPWNGELGGISKEYSLTLILVASWIVGILFWGVVNLKKGKKDLSWDKNVAVQSEKCFHKFGVKIFGSNNPELIKKAFDEVHKYHSECHSLKNLDNPGKIKRDYFDAYYNVQEHGLLGNVPVLESLSEFFKNFFLILIYWFVIFILALICYSNHPVKCCQCCDCCVETNLILALGLCPWIVIIGFLGLAICCGCFRSRTEVLIHKTILYANQYLLSIGK